jgi:hypothetical protein
VTASRILILPIRAPLLQCLGDFAVNFHRNQKSIGVGYYGPQKAQQPIETPSPFSRHSQKFVRVPQMPLGISTEFRPIDVEEAETLHDRWSFGLQAADLIVSLTRQEAAKRFVGGSKICLPKP